MLKIISRSNWLLAQAKYEEILAKANAEAQRLIEEVRGTRRLVGGAEAPGGCRCRGADHLEGAGGNGLGERSSHDRE